MSQTGLSHMQDAPIREAGDVDNSKFKGMACVFILFSSYQTLFFSLLVIFFIRFPFSCEYLHIPSTKYVLMISKQ
jgi:hypothetical protein